MRRIALALALLGAAAGSARAEKVRMTAASYSDKTGPYLEKMAAEFHDANPGIDIKVEMVAWDKLLQKLQSDLADGSNADLSIIATRWLPEFVKAGHVAALDRTMSAEFRGRFIRPLLAPGQIGGNTYGLPITASARALYYNKDLLAKAGLGAPPASWDEVMADAEKLRAAGIAGFGLQGKAAETDIYWYYALWTEGGDVLGRDGKAAFAGVAGVTALDLYKTMIDRGLTEDAPTDHTREDLEDLFRHGGLAMMITTPALINRVAREAPQLNYGVAPLPKGTTNATYATTDSVVLFRNSKAPKAAWKFLEFLFTKDARVEFTRGEGLLPTTRAEAADAFFASNERLKSFVNLLPDARFAPAVAGWDEIARAVSEAVQSVYLGEATPEAALQAAAQQVDSATGK